MNCLLEAVLNIWRVMFPCMPVVFPRLALQHLPFYWKTRRSHEKWSEPFFKPNHQPNPGIRGVLSVRFLQLSLLEGGCADASFTTYKPSFGSSLAFILGWLQHQVIKRDGVVDTKKNTHVVRTIVWLSRKQWVYNHICISICLRVLHAFAYCVLLQDHCLLMCHMPKGACRLGSPRPLGISSKGLWSR